MRSRPAFPRTKTPLLVLRLGDYAAGAATAAAAAAAVHAAVENGSDMVLAMLLGMAHAPSLIYSSWRSRGRSWASCR